MSQRYPRRAFIQHLTFFGGGLVLLGGEACTPKPGSSAPDGGGVAHRSLTERQFKTLSAACERILPRDQDPGALDANVPEYVDRMLQAPEMETLRPVLVEGLDLLERRGRALTRVSYAEAPADRQDFLLRNFRDSPTGSGEERFYELLVVMTLEGFLGDPSYGGNKDYVGWKLVGFMAPGPTHMHHHGG